MYTLFEYYPEYWIPAVLALIAIIAFCVRLVVRAHADRVTTGNEGLVGEHGVYRGNDLVFVHGELWKIQSSAGLRAGDRVLVRAVDRLTVTVEKTETPS
jgi:membrane-bound serine protease (ClpP class)